MSLERLASSRDARSSASSRRHAQRVCPDPVLELEDVSVGVIDWSRRGHTPGSWGKEGEVSPPTLGNAREGPSQSTFTV